jgi:hypothetical protein
MLWFAPFFALLILCGLAGRRIVDKWTSDMGRLVKR